MGKHIDKHLGCPSWPNCDEAPMGCIVESEGDVEWYGHKDNPNAYTGDAPSTEASFYKKTFVGISETEYKKSEVEDLDNQSYSEGEEYGNE